jgi:hypothetical protein
MTAEGYDESALLPAAAGNFDNDVAEELVLAYGRTLYVRDDTGAGLEAMGSYELPEEAAGSAVALATVPIDGQVRDELCRRRVAGVGDPGHGP